MISIIVATYNRAELLKQSLTSIFNQTYSNFEVLIVDDGSTDNTEEMIRKDFNNPKIRYFKLPENLGATNARNFGISKVAGEYFMVWDSDDALYPNALEKVMNIFKKFDVAVVSAPAKSLLNGNEVKYPVLNEGIIDPDKLRVRMLPSNHKIRVAKTSLCKNVRYHSKNIDFLVNVELSECGSWYCINEYLGEVRLFSSKNSLSSLRKKTNLKLSVERSKFLSAYIIKYKNLLKKKNPVVYAGICYGLAVGCLYQNLKLKSLIYIKESLVSNFNIKYPFFAFFILLPFSKDMLILLVKIKNLFSNYSFI